MPLEKGILVATDQNQEWLLSWWWERYQAFNSLPVVFVDFGMSQQGKDWCQERGQVIDLKINADFQNPSPEKCKEWEAFYGDLYLKARSAWFKKPSACLLSPFEKTLWLDLDCEVLCCLNEIFDYLEKDKEIAVVFSEEECSLPCLKGSDLGSNSGVFLFSKKSDLIQKWAEISMEKSHEYWGDHWILSFLINEHPEKISILPEEYHWKMNRGILIDAKIIHWCGEWGKKHILKYGGIKPILEKLSLI